MARLLILIFTLFLLSCADIQQGENDEFPENFWMLPAYKLPHERKITLKGDQWHDFRLKHPEWFAITIPPNKADYKLLEEYEDVQILLLAYPSTGLSGAVTKSLVEMAKAALEYVEVHVVSNSTAAQQNFTKKLKEAGVSQELIDAKLKYIPFELDSIWIVDFGPFPLKDTKGNIAFSDFRYYHYRVWDDAIPSRLAQHYGTTAFRAPLDFEGGNMYYDGKGTCFHTQGVFWANPDMTEEEVQKVFSRYLGCEEFVVLKPLKGEGTTHIDMFFKLTDPTSAILGEYTEAQDLINKKVLNENAAILEAFIPPSGGKFKVYRLPMPDNSSSGIKVWRTYLNSTFVKPLNLWPVYSINKDLEATALAVWQEAMPDFEHVGINSDAVITWGGAMHCISRTIMNGTFTKWVADGKCVNNKCIAPEDGYSGDCTDDTQCYGAKMLCLCNDCKTDCKPTQPTECGNIHWEGCCEKDGTLKYCDEGFLQTMPCGSWNNCGWNAEMGYYDCGFSGSDPSGKFPKECPQGPCGDVPETGICEGNVLKYCLFGTKLETTDCTTLNKVCGEDPQQPGSFACIEPCENECEENLKECSEDGLYTVTCAKEGACFKKVLTACGEGKVCENGECVDPPKPEPDEEMQAEYAAEQEHETHPEHAAEQKPDILQETIQEISEEPSQAEEERKSRGSGCSVNSTGHNFVVLLLITLFSAFIRKFSPFSS